MREYLIFRLHGALASWGDIAVGDIRPSYRCPSKSAVIGLIATALGIERLEQLKQAELFKLSFSLRIDAPGHPVEDYHTVQTPDDMSIKHDRSKDYWTRLDEIEAINGRIIQTQKNAGAIQSRRTYYCDALYTIALNDPVDKSIDWHILGLKQFSDLISALQNPELCLYLGRKSCPLSLPLEPQIHACDNFKIALQKASFKFNEELSLLLKSEQHQYYSEEKLDNSQMKITRRDQPVNKTTWQFSERDEYYFIE